MQSIVAFPLPGSGVPATPTSPASEVELSIPRLKAVQIKLKSLGLYEGSVDGIFGTKSRTALKVFQAENGLPKTGKLTQATVDALGV